MDDPAGNFDAGIARRLGGKIVGAAVDDDSPANNLLYQKAASQKRGYRLAVVPKQGRHIPGVGGVAAARRVIMGHSMGEGALCAAAAVCALVDMEPKNLPLAGLARLGEPADFSINDNAFVGLVKPGFPGYPRESPAACDNGFRLRAAAQSLEEVDGL